ncbi:MAG TPA: catalase family peroxidase [Gemmataceae bacterium]|nr:catalase family peroxidase [Gemmataceae bacterium]
MAGTSQGKSVEEQIFDIQRAVAGPHPGFRPVHAKGIICSGNFVATPGARKISRAAHLQGNPIATTIRFSNGNGDPHVHDGLPNVRALAVKFLLPGGGKTDLLANSVEGFLVRTAEEFLEFLQANLPDPATGKPDPDAVPRFFQSHPAAPAFLGRLMQKPVPASYAQATYFANHAFRLTAADGSSRFGRYRWIPEAGESFLTPEEGGKRDPEFLLKELTSRLAQGPVAFRLHLQLAQEGDLTGDVTILWPSDRLVELGRLTIDAISPSSAADEKRLIFDPTNLTDGIDLSDDPLPRARSAAYSVSYEERTKGM